MNRVEIVARATFKMVAGPVEYGIEAYRRKGTPRYAIVRRCGGGPWVRSSTWDSRDGAHNELRTWLKGAERV